MYAHSTICELMAQDILKGINFKMFKFGKSNKEITLF